MYFLFVSLVAASRCTHAYTIAMDAVRRVGEGRRHRHTLFIRSGRRGGTSV